MWVYTTKGHISVVQHFDKVGTFIVRSRQLSTAIHAARLSVSGIAARPDGSQPMVTAMSDADYPYRFECNQIELTILMTMLIGDINYPNFKAAASGNTELTGRGYVAHLHDTHENWMDHNTADFERFQEDVTDLIAATEAGTVEVVEGR